MHIKSVVSALQNDFSIFSPLGLKLEELEELRAKAHSNSLLPEINKRRTYQIKSRDLFSKYKKQILILLSTLVLIAKNETNNSPEIAAKLRIGSISRKKPDEMIGIAENIHAELTALAATLPPTTALTSLLLEEFGTAIANAREARREYAQTRAAASSSARETVAMMNQLYVDMMKVVRLCRPYCELHAPYLLPLIASEPPKQKRRRKLRKTLREKKKNPQKAAEAAPKKTRKRRK